MNFTVFIYKDKRYHPSKLVRVVVLESDRGYSHIRLEGAEDWDDMG